MYLANVFSLPFVTHAYYKVQFTVMATFVLLAEGYGLWVMGLQPNTHHLSPITI